MKQKFKRLSLVHISRDMPSGMGHFPSDFDAIIEGTYSQIYGGYDIDSYALYRMDKGVIVDINSWYPESTISLLPEQDMDKAENMIENYNLKEDSL